MVDIPKEILDRRYLGVPFEVPFWAEDAWSFCARPDEAERVMANNSANLGPGSRLEAVCYLEIDGEKIYRGAVFSVPRI